MRVRVDRGADAVCVNLTDRSIKDSEKSLTGSLSTNDHEGRIVGVEILDASKRTDDPAVLTQFSFELLTVGLRIPNKLRLDALKRIRPVSSLLSEDLIVV